MRPALATAALLLATVAPATPPPDACAQTAAAMGDDWNDVACAGEARVLENPSNLEVRARIQLRDRCPGDGPDGARTRAWVQYLDVPRAGPALCELPRAEGEQRCTVAVPPRSELRLSCEGEHDEGGHGCAFRVRTRPRW